VGHAAQHIHVYAVTRGPERPVPLDGADGIDEDAVEVEKQGVAVHAGSMKEGWIRAALYAPVREAGRASAGGRGPDWSLRHPASATSAGAGSGEMPRIRWNSRRQVANCVWYESPAPVVFVRVSYESTSPSRR
jgi:hypothetical protein